MSSLTKVEYEWKNMLHVSLCELYEYFLQPVHESKQQSGWINSERWGKFLKGSKHEKYQENKTNKAKPQYNLQAIKKRCNSHLP